MAVTAPICPLCGSVCEDDNERRRLLSKRYYSDDTRLANAAPAWWCNHCCRWLDGCQWEADYQARKKGVEPADGTEPVAKKTRRKTAAASPTAEPVPAAAVAEKPKRRKKDAGTEG